MRVSSKYRRVICTILIGVLICFHIVVFCVEVYAKEETTTNVVEVSGSNDCDIVFLLDISGSMKQTDKNRISVEIMKMMTDICSLGKNRVGFVGYNDTIAYTYSLTDVRNKKKRTQLKKYMGKVDFKGETDIGLGLKKAVSMLVENAKTGNTPIICMLSDGKTDLANSHTGRTKQQSEKDVKNSISIAKKNGIKVYTVGLSNQFSEIVDYLEVISKQTEGEAYVASSPFQLLEIINGIMSSYQSSILVNQTTELGNGKLQKYKLSIPDYSVSKYRIVLLSSAKIQMSGIVESSELETEVGDSKYYSILELDHPTNKEITFYYKVPKGASISINAQAIFNFQGEFTIQDEMTIGKNAVVSFQFMDKKTKKSVPLEDFFLKVKCDFFAVNSETGEQVQISSKKIEKSYVIDFYPNSSGKYYIVAKYEGDFGKGYYQSETFEIKEKAPKLIRTLDVDVCIGKGKEYDLKKLFESKVETNFQYSVIGDWKEIASVMAEDSILNIQGKEIGTRKVSVLAENEDACFEIQLNIKVGTFWAIYQEKIVGVVLVGIIIFTLFLYLIVYMMQSRKRKKAMEKEFSGSLLGYFTDIKSANDLHSMEWELKQYPGVGITLNTLLKEVKIPDYFLGAERVWIYPYDNKRITIVHNLRGSIFVGNKLVEKNIPVCICHGDVIYVCFEENGAEIELHYKNIGGN